MNIGWKMKRIVIVIFVLIAITPAIAKSGYEVTTSDRRFLSEFLKAVERKDTMWIATHSSLPMIVMTDGKRRLVKDEKEFASVLSRMLTADFSARIQSAGKMDLFSNWQGVMVGDGILWFAKVRLSEHSPSRYSILAFGGFAFQPEEAAKPVE